MVTLWNSTFFRSSSLMYITGLGTKIKLFVKKKRCPSDAFIEVLTPLCFVELHEVILYKNQFNYTFQSLLE